ncbi:MAG: hypothetical protein IJO65_02665 [Lachnospiraceae bacterium]|nr:hypothetical protein [Lachnospiraceae bacterium]
MIEESANMPTTENALLKQCKLKFINCYKMNGKVMNTSVYVDKFIQKIRVAGVSLERLSHMAGQMMMLSVLTAGIAVCISLAAGDTLFQIIPYYLASILGLYLYFSVSGIVDIVGKKQVLKTNLVDYLENHLMPRLELEKETEKEKAETVQNAAERINSGKEYMKTNSENDTAEKKDILIDYTDELEDLLKEFLA